MRTFCNAEDGNLVSVVVDGDRVKKLNQDHLESVFYALLGGNTYFVLEEEKSLPWYDGVVMELKNAGKTAIIKYDDGEIVPLSVLGNGQEDRVFNWKRLS